MARERSNPVPKSSLRLRMAFFVTSLLGLIVIAVPLAVFLGRLEDASSSNSAFEVTRRFLEVVQVVAKVVRLSATEAAGLLLALASIAVAFILFVAAKRDSQPLFSVASRTVVVYKARPAEKIWAAHFFFWNGGRKAIRKEDIPKPIGLTLGPRATLLSASLLAVTDEAANPRLMAAYRNADGAYVVPFAFDYLNRDDGLAIELIYEGEEHQPIDVTGTILDAEIERLTVDRMGLKQGFLPMLYSYLLIGLPFTLLGPAVAVLIGMAFDLSGSAFSIILLLSCLATGASAGYYSRDAEHRWLPQIPMTLRRASWDRE